MTKRVLVVLVVLAVAATACSSQPETCDEVADETIALAQDLIDDVEDEFGDESLADIIDLFLSGEQPPPVAEYEERAEVLSERAGELGCTQQQFEEAIVARAHRLRATTDIGEFIIDAIERGGL